MTSRTLTLLLVIVLALAGIVYLLQYPTSPKDVARIAPGAFIFPGLPVNDITTIRIDSFDDTVTLQRKDDIWRVKEFNQFPARFSFIAEFLTQLHDLRVGQIVRAREESHGRLRLVPPHEALSPDTAGMHVTLFTQDSEEPVASLIIGRMKQGAQDASPMGFPGGMPEGHYILTPYGDIALVTEVFRITRTPDSWIDKNIADIPHTDVAHIIITPPDAPVYTLARATPEASLLPQNISDDELPRETHIRDLASSLSRLNASDVLSDTHTLTGAVWRSDITTFNGITYAARVTTETDAPAHFMIDAHYSGLPSHMTNDITHLDVLSEQDAQARVEHFNTRFSGWVFTVPPHKAEQMRVYRDDLVDDAEDVAPPVYPDDDI